MGDPSERALQYCRVPRLELHSIRGGERYGLSAHAGRAGFGGVAATLCPHDAWCRRHDRDRRRGGSACIAGLVCGGQLDGRIAEHNAVLDRSEPLAYSAQNLYAALSAADAAAASAFLSGGIETAAMQERYQQALG